LKEVSGRSWERVTEGKTGKRQEKGGKTTGERQERGSGSRKVARVVRA